MRVREGDTDDISGIIELLKELHVESVFKDVPFSDSTTRQFILTMMGIKDGTILVVADDKDRPQGVMIGMIDSLFFSKKRYATDVVFYVRDAAAQQAPWMVKRFRRWAKGRPGVYKLMMGISSGIDNEGRTEQLYEALGLEKIGGLFIQEIKR